jgi:hypothetical protein
MSPFHKTTADMRQATTRNQRRVERWFYISTALFMILLSVAGFGPSVVDHSRRNAPSTSLVAAHSIATGAWLLLFLVQASLVATRRTAVHRRLGRVGPLVALVLIVVGYLAIIEFGRRGYDLSGDLIRALSRTGSPRRDPAGLVFPLADLLSFGLLAAAGLWYRHRPETHKRLMLFALIALAGEPILHLVGNLAGDWPTLRGAGIKISVPITLVLLSGSAIYDRISRGRIHPVSLWVPIVLFAWQNVVVVFVVFRSALWREFAAWLIQ